jgi:predicted AlkP superfamily phosphohydrolase/phosphomutase
MAVRSPVVFIGIDGGEPRLIRQWIAEGHLPTLGKLCEQGVSGDVDTLPGMGDGAVWPTLVTGVNPARHGRYFRRQIQPGTYGSMLFDVERDLKYPAFWDRISASGRRVAILDLPYAPTTNTANGVCLTDWLIHDRYGSPRSYPPEFIDDILSRFGDDPVEGNSDKVAKDGGSLRVLLGQLVDRVRRKEAMVRETCGREPWDFTATAFTEPHDLGHVAWHLHDPRHPNHDAEWLAEHGDPLKTLYMAIDGAIGRIIDDLDPRATVMIFIGLGMGPNYTANALVPDILARLQGFGTYTLGNVPILWRLLRKYRRVRSKYFDIPHNENSAAIRINLRGREPLGRILPRDKDKVCEELSGAFRELVDPVTQAPIVRQIVRVDRELAGEHLDALPDLFIEWNRDTPFQAVTSPRLGTIGPALSWGRTGDHSPRAMLISRRGDLLAGAFGSAPRVVDIPATILSLLDVEGSGLDGIPVDEIVAPVKASAVLASAGLS